MFHFLPFSKNQAQTLCWPSKILLSLSTGTQREWKQEKYMETGFVHLMTSRLPFKPYIFFFYSSLFLFNKISKEKETKKRDRERKEHQFQLFPVSKLSEQKNDISFSEPGLEMDFSNYKVREVSLVFMYLQQSSPISN